MKIYIGLLLQLFIAFSQAGHAQTVAPDVDFSAIPAIDKVVRGESTHIFLNIVNRSNAALTVSGLTLCADGFQWETSKGPEASPLSAFGSIQRTIKVKALSEAVFAEHRLMLVVAYSWETGGQKLASARSTTINIEVKRRFEEESKGFPGGTAALLYLLLPVIPAFLSYEILENLRTKKKLMVPTFKSEFIVPAFFAAILVSFLMLWTTKQDAGLDYSSPTTFVTVLMASILLGIVVPAIRLFWDLYQNQRWRFRPSDTWEVYARKALLGKRRRETFVWVKGAFSNETLEGILLEQPDGKRALGASFQVAPNQKANEAYWEVVVPRIEKDVVDRKGNLKNPELLLQMLRKKKLTASPQAWVRRGPTEVAGARVVDITEEFHEIEREDKPLVTLVP